MDYRGAGGQSRIDAGGPKTKRIQNTDGLLEWALPVEAEMWDSPYATRSDWVLTIYWTGEHANSRSSGGGNWMQGNYHLEIVAQRA
jgi:hypothetical protein